jgi:glycosyltransferase involved in cell wall biosynthesis
VAENILHILGTAQREGTGVARIVEALAKGLDPQQYRVHAWFLAGDGPLAKELEAAGVQVRVIDWCRSIGDPAGAWRFWRGLREEKFALIHQHWGGRAPRFVVRSRRRAKTITHLHGHLLESNGLAPLSLRSNGCDCVIATSRAVANCVVGSSARVVYPGVIIPNDRQDRPAEPRDVEEAVLGTAGRLVPLKGITYLIRALALLLRDISNVRLEIAGSGPDRDLLENEVQLHGLQNRVRFLGWQADLACAMAAWDVYVQPSVGEPFGIAALEAMAASLPVVATRDGGLPELVEDGRTGWLVPPRDPVTLADRLHALLLNPAQRRGMGAAGRVRARANFSVDRMVKSISTIYDEVLAERTRAV